jgi:hypothetical protein
LLSFPEIANHGVEVREVFDYEKILFDLVKGLTRLTHKELK